MPIDTIRAVRLLMADVGTTEYLSDAQIEEYLELNDDNTRRAAADALDAIAVSETLVGKVLRTQDLQTDGTKVADSLRRAADRHRAIADREDDDADGFAFDVVYPVGSPRRPERTGYGTETWGL